MKEGGIVSISGDSSRVVSGSDLKEKKEKNGWSPLPPFFPLPCLSTVTSKMEALQTGQSQGARMSARIAARYFIQRKG